MLHCAMEYVFPNRRKTFFDARIFRQEPRVTAVNDFFKCATRLERGRSLASGTDFRARWKWLYAPSPQAVEFASATRLQPSLPWRSLSGWSWTVRSRHLNRLGRCAGHTWGKPFQSAMAPGRHFVLGGCGQRIADRRLPPGALALFPSFGDMGRVMRRVGDFFQLLPRLFHDTDWLYRAIIALDASQAPDNVFFFAVSRST